MKITKSLLKEIIKEELESVMQEQNIRKRRWRWYNAGQRKERLKRIMDPAIGTKASQKVATKPAPEKESLEEEIYEVDAKDVNEEYCPVCAEAQLEEKKKKACKPSKGKRFAKRVDGKCRSFGQKGQAKGGGDRIRPGTAKGDAYCARSAGIKKCKNPPCANTLSRKKWRCRGKKSMKA
jgi:hypothetical protein